MNVDNYDGEENRIDRREGGVYSTPCTLGVCPGVAHSVYMVVTILVAPYYWE
jgi:hypothetical protein